MVRFAQLIMVFLLSVFALGGLTAADESITVFDGSKRDILYTTSSHAGQKQLEELMRMVPGGEGMTVTKMPYSWKNTPDKIHAYPIIVARLGNHFNPPLGIKKAPIDEAAFSAATAALEESITGRLERDQAKLWIGINGHYHQRDGSAEGDALLAVADVYTKWQEQNPRKNVIILDTITACHAHWPLTVRSDQFHAGSIANYLEALAIVKAMCANDGIELPKTVDEHVAAIVATAADQRDAFVITAPGGFEPKHEIGLGEEVTIEWTTADESVTGVYVMLHRLGHNDYFISDRIEVGSPEFGKLTWTVQDNLPTVGNKIANIGKVTRANAKKEIFKRKIPGGQKLFCFRVVNADAPSTFTFSDAFTIPFPKEYKE